MVWLAGKLQRNLATAANYVEDQRKKMSRDGFSFIEEVEAAMEEEVADSVHERISGENNFPCENCDKICKSKGGLKRHKNAKYGNKITAGKENVANT